MNEISVGEGEEKIIAKGNHRVSSVSLGRNSTLIFTGPTVIFCDKFTSGDGARILYRSDEFLSTDNHFDLWTLDASGVVSLDFIGDGKSGLDYKGKARASDGGGGRNATNPKWNDADGREAARGERGSNGMPGGRGEPAVDFMINLPLVAPGARIRFSTVGGNGGTGQNGGSGGKGGAGAKLHGAKDGGSGGDGGQGGDSGDAGFIALFIVVPDELYADLAKRNQVIGTINLVMNTSAGTPGDGGSGGSGGMRGDHRGINIGRGNPGQGPDGADGLMGKTGDGPARNSERDWARVDVISQSAHLQYWAQQVAAADRQKVYG